MSTLTGRGSPPSHGTTRGSTLSHSGAGSSSTTTGSGASTSASGGLFHAYHSATALQHHSTHLAYASSPSLTGELLRQSLSEYLRTQVAHVHQVVVLYGFNAHNMQPDEDIPITQGKLCYAAITQCECVLIDRQAIAQLSLSPIAPSYDDILHSSPRLPSQLLYCLPFHMMAKIVVDSEREDVFTIETREGGGGGMPPCFIFSSVHRKSMCETLVAFFNAHFQLAAMMPEPSAAISQAAQAALLAHAQVADSHIYITQGMDTAEGVPSSAIDPLLHSNSAATLSRLIPNNRFSVITTAANRENHLGRIRRLPLEFQETRQTYKHPSEQFYSALPSVYRGRIFHRCGYMFATRVNTGMKILQHARSSSSDISIPGGPSGVANGPQFEEKGAWADKSDLFLNRPTATYRWETPRDEEKNLPLSDRKRLEVSICSEKSISPFSNIVKSRDLRGQSLGRGREEGKATLKELLKGRDDCDDDDFFMWAEAVGRAVAMNECRSSTQNSAVAATSTNTASSTAPGAGSSASSVHSDYFVPQSLVYQKKINPCGDKSSWRCFKIHIYTPQREIGLIACRRKCLPPYFDTFQDMVFVMYGECTQNRAALVPHPDFMRELEMLIDTLSPTVVPLPFHYAQGLSETIIHPTYADVLVAQGRVNSLLNNSMGYHWLSTRSWISSVRGEYGLFPTTEFLGSACWRLATSFANSILVRVTHRRERVQWAEYMHVAVEGIGVEAAGADDQPSTTTQLSEEKPQDEEKNAGPEGGAATAKDAKASTASSATSDSSGASRVESLVADPMVIVSRMLTEFAAEEAQARRREGPQRTTYSAEEEWRCRVSQYLAYCVDDGIFPGALNIKRLLSVLTRAFLDAPILSAETSMKLDRVVDFLLYMKRRVGPPIQLPSWHQATISVQETKSNLRSGGKKRTGQTGHHAHHHHHSHHHAPKHIIKSASSEATNLHSPFASLSNTSPAATFVEVPPEDAGEYDYDERTTLLEKLRNRDLLANFTCNEHIMIPLLDTSYVESLEKATIGTAQQQDGSVVPALLASLLTKDYNIDLIRAVRDKIISYEMHSEILIPPLIALMKDGTMQTSQYALHALTMIAKYHPQAVVDAGGASMPMWFLFMSKNELLLAASIDLILALLTENTRAIFAQPQFALKLVDLLRKRVGGARYQNIVLQRASELIFRLAMMPEMLTIFLGSYAHRELVQIIGEYDRKHPILLELSACLAHLFVYAKNKMLTTPSENAKEDASIIVQTMAKCTTKAQLRVCINLLLALEILIRLPKAYYARLSNTMKSEKGTQFTLPDRAFELRILVLQHLHTREGLENVLDRASSSATAEVARCESHLRHLNALEELASPTGGKPKIRLLEPEGDTSDPQSTAARISDLIRQYTIARNVIRHCKWFKVRMNYAVAAGWNVNIMWQKDQAKTLLAAAKE